MATDPHGIFGKVAWYLDRTDHLLTEVHAGRVTIGEASDQHSKLSTQVTVAMIDAFVDRLLELRDARPVGQVAAAAPVEAYPIPYVHRAHTPAAHPEPAHGRSHGPEDPPDDQATAPEGS
jgi:hypothetical protein